LDLGPEAFCRFARGRDHVDERDALRRHPPVVALLLREVGGQLVLARRLGRAGRLLGEEEHLLNEALADDGVPLVQADALRFAHEELVFDGSLLDPLCLLGRQRAYAESLRALCAERAQLAAPQVDGAPFGWRGDREEDRADDNEVREAARGDRTHAWAET
jgi:hypothetical protein